MPDREFNYVIEQHLGVINRSDTGWTRELNIVSWNGQPPKYDIRDWDPDHERMSKGITLLDRDMKLLVDYYLKDRNRRTVADAQKEQEAREKRRREGPRSRWQSEEEYSQAVAEAAESDALTFLAGGPLPEMPEPQAAGPREGEDGGEETPGIHIGPAEETPEDTHDETPF